MTKVGTYSYMAPELVSGMPYQSSVVDLFAAGVILFNIITSQRPFTVASDRDEWYRYFYAGRADQFWKSHEKDLQAPLSQEFKELITCMLHVNPQNRLCMSDLIGHPWMQLECATQ